MCGFGRQTSTLEDSHSALDKDAPVQINVLSARGVLIEADQGPVWMYGTASEHELLYQYSLIGARNVLLAMIQTESPYFQGRSFAPASLNASPHPSFPDPDCARHYECAANVPLKPYVTSQEDRALGLHLERCHSIFVLGAGLYSFFDSYAQDTLAAHACQRRICVIDDEKPGTSSDIWLFHIATVGTEVILTMDGQDVVPEDTYREGFCSTLTLAALHPHGQTEGVFLL